MGGPSVLGLKMDAEFLVLKCVFGLGYAKYELFFINAQNILSH